MNKCILLLIAGLGSIGNAANPNATYIMTETGRGTEGAASTMANSKGNYLSNLWEERNTCWEQPKKETHLTRQGGFIQFGTGGTHGNIKVNSPTLDGNPGTYTSTSPLSSGTPSGVIYGSKDIDPSLKQNQLFGTMGFGYVTALKCDSFLTGAFNVYYTNCSGNIRCPVAIDTTLPSPNPQPDPSLPPITGLIPVTTVPQTLEFNQYQTFHLRNRWSLGASLAFGTWFGRIAPFGRLGWHMSWMRFVPDEENSPIFILNTSNTSSNNINVENNPQIVSREPKFRWMNGISAGAGLNVQLSKNVVVEFSATMVQYQSKRMEVFLGDNGIINAGNSGVTPVQPSASNRMTVFAQIEPRYFFFTVTVNVLFPEKKGFY